MKAKKIIERIIKVINIMVNMIFGFVSLCNGLGYGTNVYMYGDTYQRIFWLVVMFALINFADRFIRKMIREF